MKAIRFEQANTKITGGPAIKYDTAQDVGDLPVWKSDAADRPLIVSCWRLTFRERLSAFLFGRVWLQVAARDTQPPLGLDACRTAFDKAA